MSNELEDPPLQEIPSRVAKAHHCPYCGYGTNVKANFEKHMRSIAHGKREAVEKERERLANLQPVQTDVNEKKVICPFCQTTFAGSANLARHRKSCSEKISLVESYEKTIADLKRDHEKRIQDLVRDNEKRVHDLVLDNDKRVQNLMRVNDRLMCRIEGLNQMLQLSIQSKESFQKIAEQTVVSIAEMKRIGVDADQED